MSHAREDHCQTMLVCGLYYLAVAHGASRLYYCCDLLLGRLVDSIPKREIGIRGKNCTGKGKGRLHCPDLDRIDAAHLPCSDTYQLAFPGVYNCIELYMFCKYPCES